ncbi:MAG: LptF/LptG family permease, partial [Rhodothermales bacterium]
TALSRARSTRTLVDETRRNIEWESQRADRFRVEIHKKYSIAIACIIFVLIGAPLGLSVRRGGLGAVGALSTGIFLFYWVTLVQGEKLADRGLLTPWVGMWAANIVMVTLGLWLMLYVSKDLRATPPLRKRLLKRFQRSN